MRTQSMLTENSYLFAPSVASETRCPFLQEGGKPFAVVGIVEEGQPGAFFFLR